MATLGGMSEDQDGLEYKTMLHLRLLYRWFMDTRYLDESSCEIQRDALDKNKR